VHLVFTREQNELRGVTAEVLDSLERSGQIGDAAEAPAESAVWAQLVKLGIIGLAVPEQYGGAGFGAVELTAVAEVLGGYALPVPALATAGLFVPAVVAAGGDPVLAAVAEGRAATLAVDADDPFAPDGKRAIVVDVQGADHVAVVTASRLAVVPDGSVRVEPLDSLDPTRPLARLSVEGDLELLPGDPMPGIAVGLVACAAELVGLADALLRVSLEHARTREQFGRPIGSFQAVKHRLVDVYVLVERARSLAYLAAALAADDAGAADLVRSARRAKAAAGEAALASARAAVQVHGGTGVTREHPVSRLYLRAQQASALFGGAAHHYSALGAQP
jgi:alkylation response protein AidB-like acyl-CoA dehydrogenase